MGLKAVWLLIKIINTLIAKDRKRRKKNLLKFKFLMFFSFLYDFHVFFMFAHTQILAAHRSQFLLQAGAHTKISITRIYHSQLWEDGKQRWGCKSGYPHVWWNCRRANVEFDTDQLISKDYKNKLGILVLGTQQLIIAMQWVQMRWRQDLPDGTKLEMREKMSIMLEIQQTSENRDRL